MVADNQTTYSSSEVRRLLAQSGWHIARETLAELSDALFGEEIRPKDGGKRRWTRRHVDQLTTVGRIRAQAGLTIEEIVEAVSSDTAGWAAMVEERRRRCEAAIRDLNYIRELLGAENKGAP